MSIDWAVVASSASGFGAGLAMALASRICKRGKVEESKSYYHPSGHYLSTTLVSGNMGQSAFVYSRHLHPDALKHVFVGYDPDSTPTWDALPLIDGADHMRIRKQDKIIEFVRAIDDDEWPTQAIATMKVFLKLNRVFYWPDRETYWSARPENRELIVFDSILC